MTIDKALAKEAIKIRQGVFDKWKIVIPNQRDRESFEMALLEVHNAGYTSGYADGRDKEIAEQQKRESARVLPLEKTNG